MAETTSISWCDHSFNPWMGCTKVAPGCTNCYAEGYSKRQNKAAWGPRGTRVKTSERYWQQPLKWDRQAERDGVRRKVFCASLADVFEDWQGPIVDSNGAELWYPPDERGHCDIVTLDSLRRDLFALIDQTPNLDWLLLTKRTEQMRGMWLPSCSLCHGDGFYQPSGQEELYNCPGCLGSPYYRKNVWLGTSVSDQATADRNIPMLLECRDLCPVLFLSCEPLLEEIVLSPWLYPQRCDLHKMRQDDQRHDYKYPDCERAMSEVPTLSWVICGGESGSNHRPMELEWAHDLHRQCRDAGVAFFFKQVASRYSGAGADALGRIVQQFPRV